MAHFFFSRISIIAQTDNHLSKGEFLLGALGSGYETEYRNDFFKVINTSWEHFDEKPFIVGVLVKYKTEGETEALDNTNHIVKVPIEKPIIAHSPFLIDVDNSLLIFAENKAYIPKESFTNRIKEIIRRSLDEKFTDIEIQAIEDTYSFIKRLEEFSEIKSIKITLHPSNPNNSDLWREFDERLQNDNITSYTEIQKNTRTGESIVVDEQTESKFYMSEDGYGRSRVEGYDQQGQRLKIDSEENSRHASVSVRGTDISYSDIYENTKQKKEEITARTNER